MSPRNDAPHGGHAPRVGAQDPELRNSPIHTDPEQTFELLREQVDDQAVCWFNGTAYGDGEVVESGGTFLRCDRGIWVEAGWRKP